MYFISSPMEQFEIYPILSFNFTINNVVLYFIFAAVISMTLATAHKGEIVATWWGILNESLYRTILSLVENNIGRNYSVYFPLLYTIFHLILFSNLLGMIPYSTTPTVEIVMTLSLSFTLLFGTILLGFFTHKVLLLAAFLPAGTPLALVPLMVVLETIATLVKIISLGLRLAINLTTGHVLVKTIIGFLWAGYLDGTSIIVLLLPMFILTLFLALEILIAYLQAYIFVFIVCLTIKDLA
ncbi:ATP synthase F0 subunit 6 [Rhizoclosmatium globosum]|uniref:ATP synthase subunit a n=1 Tax=Rhizoclosmatium globosum TaxID=329046 RepID=A0A1Y2AFJ4_9FUNG|nr:ATP synthase F0 subunit 6 [Rhizoclosmatium globosum]|eukprot:ORY21214.1 ATP synthase F0 subunit 6 [Rhizoclosmatium globosum]